MTKAQIGFWLLAVGIAIHLVGNAKKAIDQSSKQQTPSNNDWLYYGATVALLLGFILKFKSLK
jgi:hypothetical protein